MVHSQSIERESISEVVAIEDANELLFVAQCGFEDTKGCYKLMHGYTVRAHSCHEAAATKLLFNFLLYRLVAILKPKGKPAQVFSTDCKRPRYRPQGSSHGFPEEPKLELVQLGRFFRKILWLGFLGGCPILGGHWFVFKRLALKDFFRFLF